MVKGSLDERHREGSREAAVTVRGGGSVVLGSPEKAELQGTKVKYITLPGQAQEENLRGACWVGQSHNPLLREGASVKRDGG